MGVFHESPAYPLKELLVELLPVTSQTLQVTHEAGVVLDSLVQLVPQDPVHLRQGVAFLLLLLKLHLKCPNFSEMAILNEGITLGLKSQDMTAGELRIEFLQNHQETRSHR